MNAFPVLWSSYRFIYIGRQLEQLSVSNFNSLGLARPRVEISNKKIQSRCWDEQQEEHARLPNQNDRRSC